MSISDAFAPARPAPAGSIVSAVLGHVVAWNDRRVTVKLLGRLTDRELDDIGLARADVAGWARRS